MPAEVIPIGPEVPESVISCSRKVVGSGGIVVYPTDTFYALGADPGNDAAVRRVFRIKGRQENQPILLLLAGSGNVGQWAGSVNAKARDLMNRFWPGPLTLVLSARADVPAALTGGTGRIGLRVPGSPVTRVLLAGMGSALTGTSANRSGDPPPRSAEAVLDSIGTDVDLILDAGISPLELPSTVVDVSRTAPVILRHGAIGAEHLL